MSFFNGQNHYIAEVIRRKEKDDRAALLVKMGEGGGGEIVMMVDMGVTWNMLRKLRRFDYVNFVYKLKMCTLL